MCDLCIVSALAVIRQLAMELSPNIRSVSMLYVRLLWSYFAACIGFGVTMYFSSRTLDRRCQL
jgi:hypothetical protein